MKLLTFIQNGSYRLGVKTDQGVVDVLAALSSAPVATKIPTTLHEVIDGGTETLNALREYIDRVLALNNDKAAPICLTNRH